MYRRRFYQVTDARKTRAQLVEELAELRRQVAEHKQSDNAVPSEWMLSVVIRAMTTFLESGSWQKATAILLSGALQQTNSEYGFAGVVVEEQGKQTLRILSHQGIVWDEQKGRALYDEALRTYQEAGYLTFTNFNNLFGRALTGKVAVIANDLKNDPRAGGIPEGHPPLSHFLGVPVLRRGTVVGMIGIANRPGGYTSVEQNQIELLVQAAGVLYDSYRRREQAAMLNARQKQIEARAEEVERRFQALLESAPYAIVSIDKDGHIVIVNAQTERTFGYNRDELLGKPVEILLPERFRNSHEKHRIDYYSNPTMRPMGANLEPFGRRKDGSEFPVDISLSSVETEGGVLAMAIIIDTTERKKDEEALKLFRTLVDGSNDAIEVIDPETGRFLDVNEKGCLDLGYSREEFLTLNVFDIDFSVDPSTFTGVVEKLRKSGSLLWEGIHRRKNGSTFPVEVNIKYVRLDRDYLVTVVRDITERKKAEAALRESERIYREAIATTGAVPFLKNLRTDAYDFVGEGIKELTGYPAEEFTPEVWDSIRQEVIPVGDFRGIPFEEANRQARTKGINWRAEVRAKTRDGGERWFSNTHAYIRSEQGEAQFALGILQDITEHKQAEATLRKAEAVLRGLVEHLPEGVCLLDEKCHLILANPKGQEYLQALADTAIDGAVTRLGELTIAQVLTSREDGLNRHEVVVKGPPRRIFEAVASPIVEDMAETGWVLVIRDVTREREIQDRMQQQDRLAAVGQLAAGIAHDFNNLLTVMMGTSQIMQFHQDLPERLKGDLKTIYTQGLRATQLIRQVLDFSRKTVIDRQPLDLVPFLKESVKMLRRMLPETIEIVTGLGDGEYVVNTSLTQLQQVLTNLSLNARDAMPGGGTLRIALSRMTLGPNEVPHLPGIEPGEWAVWTVADTGTGMPPDVMAHIFDPFFTTKPHGEGTGLGLAQVYGIVKQHGGEIDVKSEVDKGTAFTIYLPLISTEAVKPRPSSEDIPRGRGETILVVEDEPNVSKVARGFLESLNYRVLTARNGEEALESYERYREEIALVLSDLVMPEMGGEGLLKALLKRNPEVSVVFMSGYVPSQGATSRLPGDIAGFLEKPLVLENVARVIGEALRKGR